MSSGKKSVWTLLVGAVALAALYYGWMRTNGPNPAELIIEQGETVQIDAESANEGAGQNSAGSSAASSADGKSGGVEPASPFATVESDGADPDQNSDAVVTSTSSNVIQETVQEVSNELSNASEAVESTVSEVEAEAENAQEQAEELAEERLSDPIIVPETYPISEAAQYFVPKEDRRAGNLGGPPPMNFPGGPNQPVSSETGEPIAPPPLP